MKLGICYMVFDGEELLEFAIKSIREVVDYVSVTYQTTSYFGNKCNSDLVQHLENLKEKKLIDELIFFEPNLSIHHKENELKLRNIGLEFSRKNRCTHHISSDVDEFYKPEELKFAKEVMQENNYDFTMVYMETYYKSPTFLVSPSQKLMVSFIHPVTNEYKKDILYPQFPFNIETTRRFKYYEKYKVFKPDEITMHHMSYVRKNIRKKFENSDNAQFYNLEKFYSNFDNYKVGDRVCLLPEYLNRKTIEVENIFGIKF